MVKVELKCKNCGKVHTLINPRVSKEWWHRFACGGCGTYLFTDDHKKLTDFFEIKNLETSNGV